MPAWFSGLASAIAAPALKWASGLLLLLASAGGGFVWGESHATGIAAAATAHDADARVAAARKSNQALLTDYAGKLSTQTARGEALSAQLAADQAKAAAAAKTAEEAIPHAIAQNPDCDLPAAAVALLRGQPARQ